jgi:hypothetical protein
MAVEKLAAGASDVGAAGFAGFPFVRREPLAGVPEGIFSSCPVAGFAPLLKIGLGAAPLGRIRTVGGGGAASSIGSQSARRNTLGQPQSFLHSDNRRCMPHASRRGGHLALVKRRRDLAGGQAGKFIKYRTQLFGALNRVLAGLGAVGSKAA